MDTFCIYPWIQAHFHTTGEFKLCCVSGRDDLDADDGRPLSIQTHSLREIWNSKSLREVRRRMLDGEEVSACRHCMHEEEVGSSSHRMWANAAWLQHDPERFKYAKRVEKSKVTDQRVDELPVYYDLRPGNQCNLKCRMCMSEFSSLIENDPVHAPWVPSRPMTEGRFSDGRHWYNQESVLLDEILENVKETRKFLFAGGEPVINPVIRKMIDILVETGDSKHITLQFSTNLTLYPEEFFAKMESFREANFMLSLDGYGDVYDYIRYPARWETVAANLELIRKNPSVNCAITPTIQNYNLLGLTDLLEYAESVSVPYSLNMLYGPPFLSVRVMPEEARVVAAERLSSYARRSPFVRSYPGAADRIAQCIRELLEEPRVPMEDGLRDFVEFTEQLDASRGQSFHEALPELAGFLDAAGYPVARPLARTAS